MTVPSPSASRPRQSPPARWSRGGAGPPPRGRSPLAPDSPACPASPASPRAGEMPGCPPWALRPFVRSCICAPARPCTRVPVPPSPSPERVKCPGSSAGRPGHSARSGRTRAAGGNARQAGWNEPPGGATQPAGVARASRRSPAALSARVAAERAEHPGASAQWARHFARSAGREHASGRRRDGATGAPPPSASGRNAVPARGAAGAFRPLVVGTQVRARAPRQTGGTS